MVISGVAGHPLAVHITSTCPHQITFVEPVVDENVTVELFERLVVALAYACDPLDDKLAAYDIELIASYKSNRVKPVNTHPLGIRRSTIYRFPPSGLLHDFASQYL